MTDRRDAERTAEVRLRGVLEPDEKVLERVVRRALGVDREEPAGPMKAGESRESGRDRWSRSSGDARFRPRRLLVPLGAALAAATTAALVFVASLDPLPGGPRPEPAQTSISTYTSTSASVTHRDGVLIVRRLDGGASLLDARAGRSTEPRGTTIILKKGNRP